MILRYHVTAKYTKSFGVRTHERGLGSLLHMSETEILREIAVEIARQRKYSTVAVCPSRIKGGEPIVFIKNLLGQYILFENYHSGADKR